jgi:hypothetical protein
MAGYREPGVYLEVQNNPRGAILAGVQMIPLVIGSGAKKLKKTVAITRATSGQVDTLPVSVILSISHIGSSKAGASQWLASDPVAVPAVVNDYVFAAGSNTITWETGKGPSVGTTYYVTFVYTVEASQYKPTLCFGVQDVLDNYGPDIQENESGTPLSPVSLGAQIMLLQGAQSVYVIQVESAGAVPTAAEYETALDSYAKFLPNIWRIVPMDVTFDIQSVVTNHINFMSTVDERMERCAIYSRPYTSTDTAPTDVAGVKTKIGGFAAGIANQRITVIYPDVASKTLSDGSLRDLPGPYLACAITGAKSALPRQRSMTKMPFTGFSELKGVQMVRSEKNALASDGVMILEQTAVNNPITVRHQLTTDMSTTQMRENSILEIQDYCARQYRASCDPYIGKYNISPELINMIRGTLDSTSSDLIKNGVIQKARVDNVQQDANNPDTVIVSLSVLPPYPCNYIEITLVLE